MLPCFCKSLDVITVSEKKRGNKEWGEIIFCFVLFLGFSSHGSRNGRTVKVLIVWYVSLDEAYKIGPVEYVVCCSWGVSVFVCFLRLRSYWAFQSRIILTDPTPLASYRFPLCAKPRRVLLPSHRAMQFRFRLWRNLDCIGRLYWSKQTRDNSDDPAVIAAEQRWSIFLEIFSNFNASINVQSQYATL